MLPKTESKQLFKRLFLGEEVPRLPLVSCSCSIAARLMNIPTERMLQDPTLLTNAIFNAQRAIGFDAVTNIFDLNLEAEALECQISWEDPIQSPKVEEKILSSGRILTALKATENIVKMLGKTTVIIGVTTGPLILARHLRGDVFRLDLMKNSERAGKVIEIAGRICVALAKEYCNRGVNMIGVVEDGESFLRLTGQSSEKYTNVWSTLTNVTQYFDNNSIFILKGDLRSDEQFESCLRVEADAYAVDGVCDHAKLRDLANQRLKTYGQVIPAAILSGGLNGIADFLRGLLQERPVKMHFLSTPWECPPDISVGNLRKIAKLTSRT